MPASFDKVIGQTSIYEVTDDELEDLRREITRDATAVVMLGARPAPESRRAMRLESAAFYLQDLSHRLIQSDAAARHLTQVAQNPTDVDGALHFGSLLHLTQETEGAMWWWQFAAGAGNATAAYCLYLHHLGRGELRDAEHWIGQAFRLGKIDYIPPPFLPHQPLTEPSAALQQAVGRLKAEEVAGAQFHQPDHRLARLIAHLNAERLLAPSIPKQL
ncbi:hypothetical protein ACQEV9_00065 [Streptomyces chartreusis]|uniref:hypothetical protein n=1 Tax=Streptomyces chartreusis TaxID=1969 RepID=UPI003D8AD7E8